MDAPLDDETVFAGCTRLRLALADWLETLTPEQLGTPSLCPGWTVQQVAGHLLAAVGTPTRRLLREVVRHRFDLGRANVALGRATADRPVDELAARLRRRAGARLRFPVVGVHGPLSDLLIHTGDMRFPLGLELPAEPELTVAALDFLAPGAPGFVPRGRLRGLRLVATDAPNSWRDGAEVRGTLNDLIMAVSGRTVTVDRLDGPGVGVLADRLSRG